LLTIGQYLQPTAHQIDVAEYVHPEVFAWYQEVAASLGYRVAASAPLVRSSYHAAEVWLERSSVYAGNFH
jgi:lipoic acid synthetase